MFRARGGGWMSASGGRVTGDIGLDPIVLGERPGCFDAQRYALIGVRSFVESRNALAEFV
jgi:hypothetical protein